MDWYSMFVGITMPLIALWLGAKLTRKFNRDESIRNELNQRIKILQVMKQELLMNKSYREQQKGSYRSRRFLSGLMLLNSSEIDAENDADLIAKTFELMRQFDNLQIAIQSGESHLSSVVTKVINPGIFESLRYGIESLLTKKTTPEIAVDAAHDNVVKILQESALEIDKACNELLECVEKKLETDLKRKNKKKMLFLFRFFV
ncbi:MAG: hypothetical protein P0Y55_17735 [Candidatus Cohnella colombiensis]|uniref:Uncharacterized protein n=1 Tax=Candidatus Cohnella colombiensis TaxID=3121368 RepID=A0AA95JBQ9_9BACL|nr:MAG: hypothetical protein P0Y55_17735 [Cohnella sp.]